MKTTILHIEDDQEIGSWVQEFLSENGYDGCYLDYIRKSCDGVYGSC